MVDQRVEGSVDRSLTVIDVLYCPGPKAASPLDGRECSCYVEPFICDDITHPENSVFQEI